MCDGGSPAHQRLVILVSETRKMRTAMKRFTIEEIERNQRERREFMDRMERRAEETKRLAAESELRMARILKRLNYVR